MLDVQPVSPYLAVVKPKKIRRDDNRPEKQLRKKIPKVEEQDAEPIQHIDEIV